MAPVRSASVVLSTLLVLGGCTKSSRPETAAPDASAALAGSAQCHAKQGDTRPLLVEWPAADRAQLEAAANQGLVAVRYDGCQLQVLSRCELEGGYDYHALTRKHDELRIRDRDALWAQIPLGAARLEAALAREGQLNVDMSVVGRREANIDQARAVGSPAACNGATHVVTALTVGAFSIYTGSAVSGRAGVTAAGAGGGGEVARETETIRRDGDLGSCSAASTTDAAPPVQCGALVRVELAPLGANGALVSDDDARKRSEAATLHRAAERWDGAATGSRIGAAITAAGALGSVVFVVVRSIQISSAKFDLDSAERTADDTVLASDAERARAAEKIVELERDIDSYESSRRTAGFVGLGLAIGSATLFGLSFGARKRSHTLERRANALSIAPMGGPSFGGVRLSGRF